ncbi:MAG TPA: hypothetical protein VGL34_14645 [Steroidobacteraceae bacterium]
MKLLLEPTAAALRRGMVRCERFSGPGWRQSYRQFGVVVRLAAFAEASAAE